MVPSGVWVLAAPAAALAPLTPVLEARRAVQPVLVLSAPVEGPSPFDTMVPALAQVEALIAAVTTRLSTTSRARIAEIEALRQQSGITEDEHPPHQKTAPNAAGQAGD